MFELRGLSRDDLHAELVKSPLGQILASSLTSKEVPPVEPVESYYTRPTKQPNRRGDHAQRVLDRHKETAYIATCRITNRRLGPAD